MSFTENTQNWDNLSKTQKIMKNPEKSESLTTLGAILKYLGNFWQSLGITKEL